MQFEPWLTKEAPKGGLQQLYRFPNGYGASVIPDEGHPTDKELCVVLWTGPGTYDWAYVQHTDVAPSDAVVRIGGDPSHLQELLEQISLFTPEVVAYQQAKNAPWRSHRDDE